MKNVTLTIKIITLCYSNLIIFELLHNRCSKYGVIFTFSRYLRKIKYHNIFGSKIVIYKQFVCFVCMNGLQLSTYYSLIKNKDLFDLLIIRFELCT